MPDAAPTWKKVVLWAFAAGCALPVVTPPLALALGLGAACVLGGVDAARVARTQRLLLQASVVALGFGLPLPAVLATGSTGLLATGAVLAATLGAGWLLARAFAVERQTATLISTGTAICGGSAIAAVGPVIGAGPQAMSVALGCVFILNAAALFLFPPVGHLLGLDPAQFGLWAAIAIHDTSSVVGAAARFSPEALVVALPLKLARALWILPVVAWFAWRLRRPGGAAPVPWFVGLFLGASALASFVPAGAETYAWLVRAGRAGLAVTLFLVGAGLSVAAVRAVGWRPLALAAALWALVSIGALVAVRFLT